MCKLLDLVSKQGRCVFKVCKIGHTFSIPAFAGNLVHVHVILVYLSVIGALLYSERTGNSM